MIHAPNLCGSAWRHYPDGTILLVSHSIDCDEVARSIGRLPRLAQTVQAESKRRTGRGGDREGRGP